MITSTPNKGDRINISVFQTGIFYVLEPVLTGDELLDAVAMGAKAEELVRSGNQYIGIDLSTLDYIYSDSINRFINLNRAILDINGRIVIIAPHPKVYELLEKAGVLNFIKVCRSKEELMRVSEMISPTMEQAAPAAAPAPAPAAPVQPAAPAAVAPINDFQSMFEDAPQASPTQEIPQVETPAPVIPEPAPAPVIEEVVAPEPELSLSVETTEADSAFESAFEAEPVHEEKHPVAFEEETAVDDLFGDDDFGEKKKSPVVIIIVLLIIAAAGAGLFLFVNGSKSEKPAPVEKKVETPAPVEKKVEAPVDTAEIVEEAEPEKKPEPKKTPVKKTTPTRTTKKAPVKKTTAPKTTAKKISGDVITISSSPSGVDVLANGKFVGTTPHTWKSPEAYGDIEFTFRKRGYAEQVKHVEYVGGKKNISITLKKNTSVTSTASKTTNEALKKAEADRAKQREAQEQERLKAEEAARLKSEQANAAKLQAEQEQAAKLQAEQARKAEEAKKAEDARKAEEAKKAEEARKAELAKKEAAAKKAAEAAAAASAEATIYFNSLPPMADVYENGVLVGKTNVKPIKTTPGAHTYEFKKGSMTAKQSVTLREGKNSAPMIRLQ